MRAFLLFVLALGLLAGALIYLEQNNITIESLGDLSLGTKIAVATVIGVLVLALYRENFAKALKALLIWVAIALVFAVGYTYRSQLREVADKVLAEFIPGRPATSGHSVMVVRSAGGNFLVDTHVNGARVSMIFDTGASSVVLTQEDAKAAGLPLEVLNYSVTVDTANGRTRAAPVTLKTIGVGGIAEREVPALIAQPKILRRSLLGMSFLNRLKRVEVRGDRLVLEAYP